MTGEETSHDGAEGNAVGNRGIEITREQLEEWAGCQLSDDDVDRLDDAIPLSSIPDAIGAIVAALDKD